MAILDTLSSLETKETGLVANKVARFAYTQDAYDEDDVNGVVDYNPNVDNNIPVATASVMKVNDTVLNRGWRAQASALTRMLMNHFLGRLSYNVNKVHDNFLAFIASMKGSLGTANGIATLDPTGRLPASQLPFSTVEYKGAWDAGTNTPTLADGTGTLGDMYIVSVAGTQDLGNGDISFLVDDRVLYNGSVWQKISGGAVKTVNSVTPDSATGNVEITGSNIKTSALDADSVATAIETTLNDLAPSFSASSSYTVGEYVVYNKNLYKCVTAHTGAWDANNFSAVKAGTELQLKVTSVNGQTADPSTGAVVIKADDIDTESLAVLNLSITGKTWVQGTGGNTAYSFGCLYYANGIWVAGSGDGYGLWWSTDGKAWTQGTGFGAGSYVSSVYYANGIWVAGRREGYGLLWSTDGKAWTQGTGFGASNSFYGVYYANGIWVAGSSGATSSSRGLWWSTDGKAWTQGTGDNTTYGFKCLYYAEGLWVAGSENHGLWWSTDGKAWTQGTGDNTTYNSEHLYYAEGLWVSGGYGIWWSTDGKAWTRGTGIGNYSNSYSVYYANGIWVSGIGEQGLWWSTDGKAWTQGSNTTYRFGCLYYAEGLWVAGSLGRGLWYSVPTDTTKNVERILDYLDKRPVDYVADGNMNPVTSNAVFDALPIESTSTSIKMTMANRTNNIVGPSVNTTLIKLGSNWGIVIGRPAVSNTTTGIIQCHVEITGATLIETLSINAWADRDAEAMLCYNTGIEDFYVCNCSYTLGIYSRIVALVSW